MQDTRNGPKLRRHCILPGQRKGWKGLLPNWHMQKNIFFSKNYLLSDNYSPPWPTKCQLNKTPHKTLLSTHVLFPNFCYKKHNCHAYLMPWNYIIIHAKELLSLEQVFALYIINCIAWNDSHYLIEILYLKLYLIFYKSYVILNTEHLNQFLEVVCFMII